MEHSNGDIESGSDAEFGSDAEQSGSDPAEAASAGASSHAVFEAVAMVEKAVPTLDGAATWSLSDEQLREAVAGLFARLQGVEAGWLGLVRDLDARPDAVPGGRVPRWSMRSSPRMPVAMTRSRRSC